MSLQRRLFILICFGLALGTLALYWPITSHPFINFDDDDYIVGNSHVTAGLTWPGIVWAFTTNHAANWHPLTWISHMTDCQIFGLNPGGHHLTNLLFHIANTLLLFVWLKNLTGAMWRSAFVAALFAWHPLHVESVAWASERKDVLSTFFWMLTLLAWSGYVQKAEGGRRKTESNIQPSASVIGPLSSGFYWLALIFFACGLMSKPMVVTLPFVLLLLDFWPLNRFALDDKNRFRRAAILIAEKIPFFALALAGSVVTFLVQKTAGAVWASDSETHIENVLLAYARYISKLFWPHDLAIIYSFPRHWPMFLALGAALLLLVWTALFIFRARQNPYLPVGWFWFLGTLVPTIGIVQVGAQSIADRYTYIPSIGFFILVTWGVNDLLNRWPEWKRFLPIAAGIVLVALIGITSIQISYWRNSISLFLHAIEVTTDNYVAENALGKAFEKIGDNARALVLYDNATKIEPRYPQAQFNLAICLLTFNKTNEALEHLRAAANLDPHDPDIQYDLGIYFSQHGSLIDAESGLRAALTNRPNFPEAQNALGAILARQKKFSEAIPFLAQAAYLKPGEPEYHFIYGLALLDNHQPTEAARQFAEELKLTPNETKAHYRLAQALSRQRKIPEAILQYHETLRLTPDFPEAKKELDEILAAHPELKKSDALDTVK